MKLSNDFHRFAAQPVRNLKKMISMYDSQHFQYLLLSSECNCKSAIYIWMYRKISKIARSITLIWNHLMTIWNRVEQSVDFVNCWYWKGGRSLVTTTESIGVHLVYMNPFNELIMVLIKRWPFTSCQRWRFRRRAIEKFFVGLLDYLCSSSSRRLNGR